MPWGFCPMAVNDTTLLNSLFLFVLFTFKADISFCIYSCISLHSSIFRLLKSQSPQSHRPSISSFLSLFIPLPPPSPHASIRSHSPLSAFLKPTVQIRIVSMALFIRCRLIFKCVPFDCFVPCGFQCNKLFFNFYKETSVFENCTKEFD